MCRPIAGYVHNGTIQNTVFFNKEISSHRAIRALHETRTLYLIEVDVRDLGKENYPNLCSRSRNRLLNTRAFLRKFRFLKSSRARSVVEVPLNPVHLHYGTDNRECSSCSQYPLCNLCTGASYTRTHAGNRR